MNLLYDFYGELLTPKQRAYFTMHFMDDLSLAEIAAQYGVTPQAAADLLKRTGALLEKYEKVLGLLRKHIGQRPIKDKIDKTLDQLYLDQRYNDENHRTIELIKQSLNELIEV